MTIRKDEAYYDRLELMARIDELEKLAVGVTAEEDLAYIAARKQNLLDQLKEMSAKG